MRNAPLIETDKPVSRQYQKRLEENYDWQPNRGVVGGMMLPPPALAPPQAYAPPPKVTEYLPSHGSDEPQRHCLLQSSAQLMSGYTVHAQDGGIGRVEDFIVDAADWTVRYLVTHTGIWFLGKGELLAPGWIEHISYEGAEAFVNLPRSSIKDAPEYDSSLPLSRAYEQRLFDHYGRKGYWDAAEAKPFREKIANAIAETKDLLRPGDSLQTVSEKMVALDPSILPVSEGGHLVGLADEPNPGLDASSHRHDPKTTRISETMNRDIIFCHEDDLCTGALRKMEERKLSHLPVVDHEMRIVALVAREDLSARIAGASADHTEAGTLKPL